MTLTFHQKAFELLGHDPKPAQHDLLTEFSSKSGFQMPKSVVEFYSIRDAMNLLDNHGNSDPALVPANFRVDRVGELPAIHFLVENQGCCSWAFRLDSSDDPAVWVNERMRSGPALWTQTGVSFSAFIYLRFFDFQFFGQTLETGADYFFDSLPLSSEAFDDVQKRFRQETATHDWPAPKFRFWRDDKRIVVLHSSDSWQWQCFARTAESESELIGEAKALCRDFLF